jgi:nucleoside-diphosphate-sugar epimerase
MIFYNGATGSMGRYVPGALAACGAEGQALAARLEDRAGLGRELEALAARVGKGSSACLVQMAAMVSVPACEGDPAAARKTNVTDTVATVSEFVRWARERGASPRVVYVSSGHVYAAQPSGSKITETDPVEPRSEYARTKLAAEGELAKHAKEQGYPLVVARVFGLIAPRQPRSYLLQGLIRRVRENDRSPIPGLGFHRDYLDSRDVCEHLVRLGLEASGPSGPSGPSGATTTLNVCSGVPVQLREIVKCILEQVHPAEAAALASSLVEAPGRADDVPWIVGSPRLLEARLGVPARRITLAETVRDAVAAAAG